VEKLHNGYFSRDKKGDYKDTSGTTKEDDDTYHLIMRDKERLLSIDEPLRFIFSHSALREGWDNPNVFQICTLNETKSADKKRQEIGRGLRLPVNQHGERIHDETINRLTVIANESYEIFAKTLQKEYEEDYGIKFGIVPSEAFAKLPFTKDGQELLLGQEQSKKLWEHLVASDYLDRQGRIQDSFNPRSPYFKLEVPEIFSHLRASIVDVLQRYIFTNRIVNKRDERKIKLNKQVMLDPAFAELWQRISQYTRYRVSFATEELIKKAAQRIQQMPKIYPLKINMDKVQVALTLAGVETKGVMEAKASYLANEVTQLPDILSYLQNEIDLTRHTLVEILLQSGRLEEFTINPQAFISSVAVEINKALRELKLDGIHYEKIAGEHW
jgi:type III restriction enzyme